MVALAGQDRYEYVRDLSAGAHGFVQLAKDMARKEELVSRQFSSWSAWSFAADACCDLALVLKVAIKFLPRGEGTVNEYVLRELLHHRLLLHPHIIQVKCGEILEGNS